MNEEQKNGSVESGSPIVDKVDGVPSDQNQNAFDGTEGETQETDKNVEGGVEGKIDPAQHKELESLVGTQGQELGELRKFFNDISPLLEKLDESPEVVQAIVDGKITQDIAKAALEGKVSIEDAKIVDKAHEEVKKDLGKEGYEGASADEVSKMVEEKAKEIQTEVDKKLKERDEISAFESNVQDFITRTPDFGKYAEAVDKWLDDHDVTDIAVAYYAVKGEISEKEAKKKAEEDKAKAGKDLALNATGGSNRATHIEGDSKVIDQLIAGKTNPNNF